MSYRWSPMTCSWWWAPFLWRIQWLEGLTASSRSGGGTSTLRWTRRARRWWGSRAMLRGKLCQGEQPTMSHLMWSSRKSKRLEHLDLTVSNLPSFRSKQSKNWCLIFHHWAAQSVPLPIHLNVWHLMMGVPVTLSSWIHWQISSGKETRGPGFDAKEEGGIGSQVFSARSPRKQGCLKSTQTAVCGQLWSQSCWKQVMTADRSWPSPAIKRRPWSNTTADSWRGCRRRGRRRRQPCWLLQEGTSYVVLIKMLRRYFAHFTWSS